jgi:hypothetical protein
MPGNSDPLIPYQPIDGRTIKYPYISTSFKEACIAAIGTCPNRRDSVRLV